MRSLLNIAALRSRTVDLIACQLGSKVMLEGVDNICATGEPTGDVGALAGWVTGKKLEFSLWDTVEPDWGIPYELTLRVSGIRKIHC